VAKGWNLGERSEEIIGTQCTENPKPDRIEAQPRRWSWVILQKAQHVLASSIIMSVEENMLKDKIVACGKTLLFMFKTGST